MSMPTRSCVTPTPPCTRPSVVVRDDPCCSRRRCPKRPFIPETESTSPRLRIEGPVDDWERWTDMAFPEGSDLLLPLGLAPLGAQDGMGAYGEPKVWTLHSI